MWQFVCLARSSYAKSGSTTSGSLNCSDLVSQELEWKHIIDTIRQDHTNNAEKYILLMMYYKLNQFQI